VPREEKKEREVREEVQRSTKKPVSPLPQHNHRPSESANAAKPPSMRRSAEPPQRPPHPFAIATPRRIEAKNHRPTERGTTKCDVCCTRLHAWRPSPTPTAKAVAMAAGKPGRAPPTWPTAPAQRPPTGARCGPRSSCPPTPPTLARPPVRRSRFPAGGPGAPPHPPTPPARRHTQPSGAHQTYPHGAAPLGSTPPPRPPPSAPPPPAQRRGRGGTRRRRAASTPRGPRSGRKPPWGRRVGQDSGGVASAVGGGEGRGRRERGSPAGRRREGRGRREDGRGWWRRGVAAGPRRRNGGRPRPRVAAPARFGGARIGWTPPLPAGGAVPTCRGIARDRCAEVREVIANPRSC